jgi:hypothetical protein
MYVRTIDAGISMKAAGGDTSGTPQPFENVERYKARLVRDRFDRALLLEYLAALDIPRGRARPVRRRRPRH